MGKRGPAPKPKALKLVQGTHRPDREAPNAPDPEVSPPSCPTWLHREAKREWRRIVPELVRLGLLAEVDRAALAAYCQSYATWWRMERDIEENGDVQINARSGLESARPQVAMRDKALDTMRRLLAEFGLTPSSRTRVSAAEKPKPQTNAFAKLGTR